MVLPKLESPMNIMKVYVSFVGICEKGRCGVGNADSSSESVSVEYCRVIDYFSSASFTVGYHSSDCYRRIHDGIRRKNLIVG